MPLTLIVPEEDSPAARIGRLLIDDGRCTTASSAPAGGVLIHAFDTPDDIGFLDLDEDRIEALLVEQTLRRVADLQAALPRLARPGNIVVIGSDAYLGRWHRVAQAAASAAMTGIIRSIALEYARDQLRINLLALPGTPLEDDAALLDDAARIAFDLLTTRAITGETILLDDGNNLMMRQARRR